MWHIKDRLAEREKDVPPGSLYHDARVEIERLEAENKRLREELEWCKRRLRQAGWVTKAVKGGDDD